MTPLHIITGFLGSGKTTLLKNILQRYADEKSIAIIQNEFAQAGVDGKELVATEHPFILKEINNGSVFCVCRVTDFEDTILELVDKHSPDAIFLEASGLSDPINIIEVLKSEKLIGKIILGKITTIVDALNFDKMWNLMPRYKHQIMIADAIVLNKLDKVENKIFLESHSKLSMINPLASILISTFCTFNLEKLFDFNNSKSQHPAERFLSTSSAGRPDIMSGVIRLRGKISRDNLRMLIQKYQPECLRIKGFFQLTTGESVLAQSVFDSIEMEETEHRQEINECIFFGTDISFSEIKQVMSKYFIN